MAARAKRGSGKKTTAKKVPKATDIERSRERRVKKVTAARNGQPTARKAPPPSNGHSTDVRTLNDLTAALRAAASGDFSGRVPGRRGSASGEAAVAYNELVTLMDNMTKEFVRISRVVGREGRMTERVRFPQAKGDWLTRVNSVNSLIDDLVRPTTEVARVIEAVAQGDLSQKMALKIEGQPVKGEFLRIGTAVNSMLDQLSSFAAEVTRVAREVGTDGKLGGQAKVKGVSGTWKDLTDSVNNMASNLTTQVRNIATVTTAVANGDLSQKITVDVKGEVLELKNTINTMVDQLSSFADEVTRVAREVGTEGKLGGQAQVKGVSGTWRDLTDNVNFLAANLTSQVRNIAQVTTAVARGDLSQKITVDAKGEVLELKNTINTMVDQLSTFADEVTRVAREVGTEGKLGGQARVEGVSGTWRDLTDNVNFLASNLTSQVRNIAAVTTAVARGDLSQKITVEAKGEVAALAETINAMTDTLSAFADEVTRVAREVGTDGKLGGQATVQGVAGTWKDLTDAVNFMASNLTVQVRDIAAVTTAVANGDLSQKITVDVKGEVLELKQTINTMVDQLSSFADEVTRVAREVGTEGKLGGQAEVKGVSGVWRDLTDNVNFLAANLTSQVRNIAAVTTAVARGDLSQKITVEAKGEVAALAETINTMTDTLSAFAAEVTRVAREVGTEGKLGGQAQVEGVAGTWKDLTDNVNFMASSLTSQVREIAAVTTAVANGDLTQKITVDVKGEVLELKKTINTMVDQLSTFADEVTRVAREVGTEGKLGGQAKVEGVSGTWKSLTENVNFMADNLTTQVRNIAAVTTAVANGDLSKKITVEAKGEVATLAETINTMVDQLSTFADEVTRVAREVGTEGILGGQARVEGVSGTWQDLTNNVNFLAANLTGQVRNIAQVTTAVARGDLTQKITVDAKGEVLELKNTINTMVDQLSTFAAEVTRVAREVGTDGKLGGQAEVKGVSGVWKDLTENVNFMASNLTDQVRDIAQVTTAVAKGDLTQKITVDVKGEILELKNTINVMVDQLSSFAEEVTRVAREVGTEGRLGGQAQVKGVSGTWKDLTDSVNQLAGNLTTQVRNIAQVTTAVAKGDLSQKITVDVKGEVLELKKTINTMVDQLSTFADEVTRVAKEVGTEGKLGGQAEVRGVSGVWRDLTENVNFMASNLTDQVRNIAAVTTAVAKGDLSKKITVEAKGEILQLKETINTMVDQLQSFVTEVTRVAREVGTEGKLGGQAEVAGASGVWRGLTENVNQMASSLTTQVRAIADVATAVTEGDLTRSITVEASGEVAELKDKINQMITNLADTTNRNEEQDWLKTNLAKISSMMQGQRDLQTVSRLIMSELTPTVSAQHGAFFLAEGVEEAEEVTLKLKASYGYKKRKNVPTWFKMGEGLVGQCALEKQPILITEAPGDYIKVTSGLGESAPVNVIVLPVLFEEQVLGVIELASFRPFSQVNQTLLDQVIETIGVVLNTIIANMRTEELLEQSQRLTQELQSQSEELQTQQEELQQTNEELQEKAELLAEQNRKIEIKNQEIEMARIGLEEKAQQLALSSKYKSEFLANMSHELRTPLNSLLILAKLLSHNEQGNLDDKQVEYAATIHNAGSDLLSLINDILDLSKVEAGKMDLNPAEVPMTAVKEDLEQAFNPVAQQQKLTFEVNISNKSTKMITTDQQRLTQVLNNLLSNAFKFTHEGGVKVNIDLAPKNTVFVNEHLAKAGKVIGFSVVDTGVGVPPDKLRLIFEAFQQAEGGISRKYGGTGLGLSISREIARLLGGEIQVQSKDGEGSTFTLYLPIKYKPIEPVNLLRRASDMDPTMLVPDPISGVEHEQATALLLDTHDPQLLAATEVEDDRSELQPGDKVLLGIAGEAKHAKTMVDVGRVKGFKVLVALKGDSGMAMAREYTPDAILLDTELPVVDGLIVLHHMKRDSSTRHIPVTVISDEAARQHALKSGAIGYVAKPITKKKVTEAVTQMGEFLERPVKNLLIVEDDETERNAMAELIGGGDDVNITSVGTSKEAMAQLDKKRFDCMVLDLKLPDGSGFELLESFKSEERFAHLPVIIYTGKELSRAEETKLRKHAETIIVKDVHSPARLLDETALFLHRMESRLPSEKRMMIEQLHTADDVFMGKKILIVDDDVRNVFALTSVLETRGMNVVYAENGKDGIDRLKENTDTGLVLMDIMMPEMDGYETMQVIRKLNEFRNLPIIALTAKAMKGDREKSIAAGASDYITKPVDTDQLLSLMRVWLYK